MTSTQQRIREKLGLTPDASDEEVLEAIPEPEPAPVLSAWSFPPPPPPMVF